MKTQEQYRVDELAENTAYISKLETDTRTKPGMYLMLTHGRNSPDEELNDWGSTGLYIGPLRWVHITYNSSINICAANDYSQSGTGPMFAKYSPLYFCNAMLHYNGVYYGDWELEFFSGEPT